MFLDFLGHKLLEEVTSTESDNGDRDDALLDFVSTPYHAEKVLTFGSLMALDAFLYALVIMPLRAIYNLWLGRSTKWRDWIQSGCGRDVFQVLVVLLTYKVVQGVNTSRVYHNLRGQAGITMFVMYSLMEVCDKFLCSVGHEISACVFSYKTTQSARRTVLFGFVNFIYTVFHSLVLMWQLVTINLASNSYSNALLSFILTNQFGEIKSAVFKRVDPDALFQLTCADITQRFQFGAILMVIVLRNFVELPSFSDFSAIKNIVGPPLLIMGAVVLADWLKMAYITNFNRLSSKEVFESFSKRLYLDYDTNGAREPQTLMSNQAGLPVTPLAIVCVRMFAKGGDITSWATPPVYLILLFIKLWLSSWLQHKVACSRRSTQTRLKAGSSPYSQSTQPKATKFQKIDSKEDENEILPKLHEELSTNLNHFHSTALSDSVDHIATAKRKSKKKRKNR